MTTSQNYRRAALDAEHRINTAYQRLDAALVQFDLDGADAIEAEIGLMLDLRDRLRRKAMIAAAWPWVLGMALVAIVVLMLWGML